MPQRAAFLQAGTFNFCVVPLSGSDAIIFAALACLCAAVLRGPLSLLLVFICGGALGVLSSWQNLGRLSNSVALWLGLSPPDLFFYIFLPPVLLDAALKIDTALFRRLLPHILLLAYGAVAATVALLAPFVLHGLGFARLGLDWVRAALFATMLAPTDPLSVSALLRAGGGPELMVVLMEGEGLFNDASAITLYSVLSGILARRAEAPGEAAADLPTVAASLAPMLRAVVRLTAVGLALGLAFGFAAQLLLGYLRRRGAGPQTEACGVMALAYLAFYAAQGPAQGSGVIAVTIFGLWGAAEGHWGAAEDEARRAGRDAVWDTLVLACNALVFFWAGAASASFLWRSAHLLNHTPWAYGVVFLVYVFMTLSRHAFFELLRPLARWRGTPLTRSHCLFATLGGLRGALSLTLLTDFLLREHASADEGLRGVDACIVLWVSSFVLLTLLVNVPLLGPVLERTGLVAASPSDLLLRREAVRRLRAHAAGALRSLRQSGEPSWNGARWDAVERSMRRGLEAPLARFQGLAASAIPPESEMGEDDGQGGDERTAPDQNETDSLLERVRPSSFSWARVSSFRLPFGDWRSRMPRENPGGARGREGEWARDAHETQPAPAQAAEPPSSPLRTAGSTPRHPLSVELPRPKQNSRRSSLVLGWEEAGSAWTSVHPPPDSQPPSMPASPLAPDPSPRTRLGALLHRGLRAMGEAVAAARAEAGLEAWPSTGSLASATSFQSDASRTQAQLRDADASLSAMLRERIVLGLSRRFQQRRARGLLSPRSWRALRSACALAREGLGRETHAPLSVWEHVSAQVRPGRLSRLGQRLEERLPEEGREGCCGRVRGEDEGAGDRGKQCS